MASSASPPRGRARSPLRIIQIPVAEGSDTITLFLLLDDGLADLARIGADDSGKVNALLDTLPLGLALANIDGRFVYLNKAFRKAAGLSKDARPVYPGDLVVDEDKAAISDLVRRFARGPSSSSDMAVRLKSQPDEPVALTIAGARGLGDAAVILSLKDNRRKRPAQAPGRAGDQDAGGRPARRRRRARFQQYPDRDHRLLRPDADAAQRPATAIMTTSSRSAPIRTAPPA